MTNRAGVATDFWTGHQTMLVCSAVQQGAETGEAADIAQLHTRLCAELPAELTNA